jgi:hypothetical protein
MATTLLAKEREANAIKTARITDLEAERDRLKAHVHESNEQHSEMVVKLMGETTEQEVRANRERRATISFARSKSTRS